MAVLQTYGSTAGNREDIYDVLQLISPEETPLFSRLGDSTANATNHQWVTWTLSTGSGNADVEGATATGSTSSSKARLNNYCQIMSKNGAISGTQRKIDNVGASEELAFEMKKKMLEWRLGAESDLILQTSNAGNSTTARTMTGLIDSLQTNRVTGSATTVALTETIFNNLLQTIFEAGAKVSTVYVAGFNKRRISQFVTSNVRYTSTDKTLKNTISVYESDFGVVDIVLERYVTKTVGIAIDDQYFRKAWLRKPITFPLAKR